MDVEMTIGDVSSETGLSKHTIRYYERIGLLPHVDRASNGHRRYSADDLGWIEFLKCLRSTGMPIAQMQQYVELTEEGDHTLQERLALLKDHRRRIKAKMRELNSFLERIEAKIDYYQGQKT